MIKIVLDIAEGLAYIHSHLIVHGDIKSLNMLVINGVVKICDFGEASYLPVPAGRRGSALYSAPELIRRDWASEYFTLKCDVWSFGILIIGKL